MGGGRHVAASNLFNWLQFFTAFLPLLQELLRTMRRTVNAINGLFTQSATVLGALGAAGLHRSALHLMTCFHRCSVACGI